MKLKGSQGPGYEIPPGPPGQRTWQWPIKRSPLLRYGVATLAVVLVLLLKLLLNPLTAQQSPFLLLAGAVVVGAWFGGLGPGVLATVLGALAGAYFAWATRGSFTVPGAGVLPLVLFVLQGLVISSLVEVLHSARRRAEESTMEARSHQESLRQSEERFRLLVEAVRDYALFMFDSEGRVSTWNKGAQRLFGYTEEEILGEPGSILFTPGDIRGGAPEGELRKAEEEGRAEDERWHVRKDGSRFRASGFVRPVRDDAGNLRGFAKVARDITELKETEDRLRESEELFRTTFEQAAVGVAQVSLEGRWLRVNQKLCEIVGYSSEELLRMTFQEITHRDDLETDLEQLRRLLAGEIATYSVEKRYIKKDGSIVWVNLTGSVVRDPDGVPEYSIAVIEDVTERKKAEEALNQSEERYRAVVKQSTDGIYLVDGDTRRILETNPALQNMLGYTAQELSGMELHEIVAHERESVYANVERTLKEGKRFIRERSYRRKDGSVVEVEVVASAIHYGGKKRVICAAIRDITERKRAEEALREAREGERRRIARDLHDDVLQDLSYTSAALAVIMLDAEGTGLEEELQKAIDAVRRAAQGLRAAVNDLRLGEERNRPFAELVQFLVERNLTRAQGYEIRLEVEEGFPVTPFGYAGVEILRIIQEALTNARRHSGAANVLVSLRREGGYLVAEISDDGRGFELATASGVGLSSMRERAAALGGKLGIESEVGQGTTVHLRVPVPEKG